MTDLKQAIAREVLDELDEHERHILWGEAIAVADRILALPAVREALARPKPFNRGYVEITGNGTGNRRHVAPRR